MSKVADGMRREPGVLALALLVASCGRAGVLRGTVFPAAAPSPVGESEAALERFAPVVIQEVAPGLAAPLDQPTALDPDGSGTLADDAASMANAPDNPVPLYAATVGDGPRLYLFYGLYYPADWSGDPRRPKIDHAGDLEGALVVVDDTTRRVEAVVTQAHRLFYVWLAGDVDPPPPPPGPSPCSTAIRSCSPSQAATVCTLMDTAGGSPVGAAGIPAGPHHSPVSDSAPSSHGLDRWRTCGASLMEARAVSATCLAAPCPHGCGRTIAAARSGL